MITRCIKEFEVKAIRLAYDDGKASSEVLGTATMFATRFSEGQARKVLKGAGVPVTRGNIIEHKEISQRVYSATDEEFMSIAHPVGVKPATTDKKKSK